MLTGTIPEEFWQHNFTLLREQYGAMIVGSLKPRFIVYESLGWIRKVLLGGVLLLLHRGSLAQIFTAMAISFAAFGRHAALRPYRCTATNVLRACTEFATFLTLATGLLLRFEGNDREAGDVLKILEYEWLAVGGFIILVPGAFVACSAYSWAESRPQTIYTLRTGSIRSAQQRHQQRPSSFTIQLDHVLGSLDSVASVASTATREATGLTEESRRQGLRVLDQDIVLAKAQGETFGQLKIALPAGGGRRRAVHVVGEGRRLVLINQTSLFTMQFTSCLLLRRSDFLQLDFPQDRGVTRNQHLPIGLLPTSFLSPLG